MSIVDNIAHIHQLIDTAAGGSPLAVLPPKLLAASKGQAYNAIEQAISGGIGDFGENRVQEAEAKWPEIKKRHPKIKLHLIGPLQTNKIKEALGLFDVIQTLDRPKLAEAIARIQGQWAGVQEKEYYIQVNTGEEPQKAGVLPAEADDFIRYCRDELKLSVVGLMCIPPADQPPAPHFALLCKIAQRNNLKELSMGMSGDYETAIRMGSTCMRLGTAIFGARN
jgi:PLP dependent protein